MNQLPPFRLDLVSDSHYPIKIKIVLYLSDWLLRAIHQLATSPSDIPRDSWLQLWSLNEKLFEFVKEFLHYLYRIGHRLPHTNSPWFNIATRTGPQYRSIPLSRASLLLPTPFNPFVFPPRAPSRPPFDPRYDW